MANSLAQLTDAYNQPETIDGLPVESVPVDIDGVRRVRINTSKPEPDPALSDFNTSVGTKLDDILNKLTGANGQQRYQLWPEKIIREGLSAAGDVMNEGTLNPGLRREDVTDIPKPDMPTKDSTWLGKLLKLAPVAAQPGDTLIEKAQAISALAGTGGLAGGAEGAALNATPSLRPALKYKDKLYKGKEGQQHQDIIPKELYPEFERMAMSGEDISNYNFGFVNDKGHFLDREKALEYGINNGLIDPHAGKYGALTSTMEMAKPDLDKAALILTPYQLQAYKDIAAGKQQLTTQLLADSSKPGVAIEAMAKTASPFFSALEHNVNQIQQSKMTGDQWLGTLSNKPGVKPEELQWTGLGEFLKENAGKPVTKTQIEEHLAGNKVELKEVNKGNVADETAPAFNQKVEEILAKAKEQNIPMMRSRAEDLAYDQMGFAPTKYHSYQLPGGENYREMLLTLPKKSEAEFLKAYQAHTGVDVSNLKPEQIANLRKNSEGKFGNDYKSSHWDEPNILAHVRMNDRTIDGKKSLHLEEIQSDWHQQGRDKGYKLSDKERTRADEIIAEGDKVGGVQNLPKAVQDEAKALSTRMVSDAPPDAPFKKSWHELALKRMIREAAEKGYDRLSWTPGEAQAARYDLSKTINQIKYNPETKRLDAIDIKGNNVISERSVSENELTNFIGKEAAEKILNNPSEKKVLSASEKPTHILNNADLKIGGEGMKGFYDQIIPKALEKIGKEHGVKVKSIGVKDIRDYEIKEIPLRGENRSVFDVRDDKDRLLSSFQTKEKAQQYIDGRKAGEAEQKGTLIHYIDIPQSLKDQAMHKGFPLFSKGGHMLMPVDHEPDFGDKK